MALTTPTPTIVKTLNFATHDQASAWLRQLGGRFVKADPATGKPLYKTSAGVVIREQTAVQYEVLANCAC